MRSAGRRALALLGTLALAVPARASAATALLQGEAGALTLGGYARSLGGLQQLGFARSEALPPTPLPDHDGASTTVLRLEWKGTLGERFSVEVHQRVYLRLESETLAFGGQKMGIGASVAPRHALDLRSVVYDEDRLRLEHDVDALAVRAILGDVDVVLGRQAITWGVGGLFPVADLWTGFSPFELDTTQKRGIDALRVLVSRGHALEVEVVVADRGTVRDLSGGLRLATYGARADAYLAVAKQWNELFTFGGASVTAGSFKLRAEVAAPLDLDGGDPPAPRASLGVDLVRSTLTLTVEGHFEGSGVGRVSDYLAHQAAPTVQRGESYLLGRWYAGAAASWKLSETFQLSITALCNLHDPSLALASAFAYRITQGTELSLGAYQGIGKVPRVLVAPGGAGVVPRLGSEFGSAGGVYYLGLSTFF